MAGRRQDRRRPAHARPAFRAAVLAAVLALASACTTTSAGSTAGRGSSPSMSPSQSMSPSMSMSPAGSVSPVSSGSTSTSASPTSLTADAPLPAVTVNDLAKNSAHRSVPIDGESFKLKVDYWTTIDTATWTATGAKNIHLLAYVQPAAGARTPEVVIDRFIPAFTLLAGNTGLNGVTAGNVVDPDAGGTALDASGAGVGGSGLPGFLLTDKVSYGSQFSAVGVGTGLADRWQQLAPHQALSEMALERAGVYAVRASMTYRLLVRNAGDAGWHRRTVVDVLTVPVKAPS